MSLSRVRRVALPVLGCAWLLWWSSDAPPAPRAQRTVPAPFAAEASPPCTGDPVPADQQAPGEPAEAAVKDPPESAEPPVVRQHDLRDLVARGYTAEGISRHVGCEQTGASITAHVNVLEVVAPAGTQLEIERLLDDKRRSGPMRVLQFYPVADLMCTEDELAALLANREAFVPGTARARADPLEIDALIGIIDACVGRGTAEIREKNRVLVVRAEPAAQAAIARILGDLRLEAPAPPRAARRRHRLTG